MKSILVVALTLLASTAPAGRPAPEEDAARARPARPGRVVLAAETLPATADGVTAGRRDGARIVLALGAEAAAIARAEDAVGAQDPATDRRIAQAIDAAMAIDLVGGTWLGWYHAALEHRRERRWVRALRAAHERGALVRASGGAAAWVARWTPAARDLLGKTAQVPHDDSPDVCVEGLGLVDGPLTGVLVAGAPGGDRVLERGVDDGFRDVLLLAGPASVEFDAAARSARFTVADGGFAAWIDVAAARRAGTVRTGLRVALAADGDVLDLRARAFRDASRVRLEEAAVERAAARLAAHLAPAVGPARVLGQRATADEGTVLTPRGGIAGLRLDVMLRAP